MADTTYFICLIYFFNLITGLDAVQATKREDRQIDQDTEPESGGANKIPDSSCFFLQTALLLSKKGPLKYKTSPNEI